MGFFDRQRNPNSQINKITTKAQDLAPFIRGCGAIFLCSYAAYKTFCRPSFLPTFRWGFLFVFCAAYKTLNSRNILGVSHNLPSMFDYINLPVGVLQSVLALFSVAYKTGLFLLSSVFFTLSLLFTLNADFLPLLLPTKH